MSLAILSMLSAIQPPTPAVSAAEKSAGAILMDGKTSFQKAMESAELLIPEGEAAELPNEGLGGDASDQALFAQWLVTSVEELLSQAVGDDVSLSGSVEGLLSKWEATPEEPLSMEVEIYTAEQLANDAVIADGVFGLILPTVLYETMQRQMGEETLLPTEEISGELPLALETDMAADWLADSQAGDEFSAVVTLVSVPAWLASLGRGQGGAEIAPLVATTAAQPQPMAGEIQLLMWAQADGKAGAGEAGEKLAALSAAELRELGTVVTDLADSEISDEVVEQLIARFVGAKAKDSASVRKDAGDVFTPLPAVNVQAQADAAIVEIGAGNKVQSLAEWMAAAVSDEPDTLGQLAAGTVTADVSTSMTNQTASQSAQTIVPNIVDRAAGAAGIEWSAQTAKFAPSQTAGQMVPPAEQVRVQITQALDAGMDKLVIELDPADLGRVEMRMEVTDGRSHIVFTAEKAETLDLLQRDARFLARALQDTGLDAQTSDMAFNLEQQSTGDDDGESTHPSSAGLQIDDVGSETEINAPTQQHYTVAVEQGVNITV